MLKHSGNLYTSALGSGYSLVLLRAIKHDTKTTDQVHTAENTGLGTHNTDAQTHQNLKGPPPVPVAEGDLPA